MGHLPEFRVGWENEHLATFLLSRISFVASPVKIGDDVGTDLFCTLFEIAEGQLFPRSSFAIQLKSSKYQIDVTEQIKYLWKLELPFFVGIVDQKNIKLSIYSGEYVPILYSNIGVPRRLALSLEDGPVSFESYRQSKSNTEHVLRMPHVLDLEGQEDRSKVDVKAQQLLQLCSRIHRNISSKANHEYLFELADGSRKPIAGIGSADYFRGNFYNRLTEVFCNLSWLYRRQPHNFRMEEYEVYDRFYLELKNVVPVPFPPHLENEYQALKQRLCRM